MSKDEKKKTRKTGKAKPYTTGELNKLIDSLIHPLSKTDERFHLVDDFLHGLVEQNPPKSVRKFMKYNLPKITNSCRKKPRIKKRQQRRPKEKMTIKFARTAAR